MKQFRVIIGDVVTPWFNADEWTLEDMNQWLEFPNVDFEYRRI